MAAIKINATGYHAQYSRFNGTTYPNISQLDLCRAAISVGASGKLDLISYGWRYLGSQLFQALSNGFLIKSMAGNLVTTPAFESKIQTEQATATYWLSMALTKLATQQIFNVPWLCHVDRLVDQGVLELTQGTNERGDLAGKDNRNLWHVVEVKGRSNKPSTTIIKKAKRQASRVTKINGQRPATASASIVKLYTTPITIDLIDPEPTTESQISWDINDSRFFPAYYEPFIRRINSSSVKSTRIRGLQYSLAMIKELAPNLWVGLPKIIIDNPQTAVDVASMFYANEQNQEISMSPVYRQRLSIGYDGILLSDGFPEEVF